MNKIIYVSIFSILISCNQTNTDKNSYIVKDSIIALDSDTTFIVKNQITQQTKPNEDLIAGYKKQLLNSFQKATLYKLTDTITADFNGDGSIDKAFYKRENQTSGIIIKHGGTNKEFRIGFGKPFSTWMDNFDCNWVDYWGLVEDRETSEVIFSDEGDISDSKNIKLNNPSIALGKEDAGGGLITFLNGKYVWIHQTC